MLVDSKSCDFETGLCGWQQTKTDNFDWTRQIGSTSSSNTGPVTDHTSISRTLNGKWKLCLIPSKKRVSAFRYQQTSTGEY